MGDSYSFDQHASVVDAVVGMADEAELDEDVGLLVLAALEGGEQLSAALDGSYVARYESGNERATAEPVGAYLSAIEVTGFRGVGPSARLPLAPGPGLTVVAGRNGSGKSSFAEALEVALTGTTYRWAKPTKFKEHWRNLHSGEPCEIRVALAEDGLGLTTVGVDWRSEADFRDFAQWTQRTGAKREPGIAALGWEGPLELFRPLLSYDELGGLLEAGPSKLFDKLDAILGIERAKDAQARLVGAATVPREQEKTLKLATRDLKKDLAGIQDPRADSARQLLAKHKHDIDAVRALATGTSTDDGDGHVALRSLIDVRIPTAQEVSEAVARLRTALAAFAKAGTSSVERLELRSSLLQDALRLHEHDGDGACPVCGSGVVDGSWRQRVEAELANEAGEIGRLRDTRRAVERARADVRGLIAQTSEPDVPAEPHLATLAAARSAWATWLSAPEEDEALCLHLETTREELERATGALSDEAAELLAEREDLWRPYAVRLSAWVDLAAKVKADEPRMQPLTSAVDFVKDAIDCLRKARLKELEDRAREIWAALRQESNVDLGSIALEGQGNRRHVELYAAVDGSDAQALGVMSQGELHALALALFLPRATMPASPFRFVVLDDPIQAMDPAKVDAFAGVLETLAKERQVVVFSHDDRLTQAIRDLGMDATILYVTREPQSVVRVKVASDPATRCLEDACALALDKKVPSDVMNRVVPGLCRTAVEAAARDVFMARRFSQGAKRVDIEDAWQSVNTTRKKVELVVGSTKIDAWLKSKPFRQGALAITGKAAHEGLTCPPLDAVKDVRRLVADLRAIP